MERLMCNGNQTKILKYNFFWYAGTNLKAVIYILAHKPHQFFLQWEYLLAPNNSLNETGISPETLSFSVQSMLQLTFSHVLIST